MIRTASTFAIPAAIALAVLALTAVARTCEAQAMTVHEGYSRDPSKVVAYTRIDISGLDPSTAAGARTLLERIEASADAVCGGVASPLTQAERRDYLDCRDEAIRGAVAKMGAPRLKTLASRRRRELFAAR